MQGIDLIKAIFLILLVPALGLLELPAQDISLPEEEAPTALLDMDLGDADVDLFIEGTWRIEAGMGAVWGTPGPVSPGVPGFGSGLLFNQIPDLTLSLWLMQRYFFETTFTEEDLFSTWLLGYEGREGEFLRRARLGNTATAIDSTPLMEIPDHPEDALGASATMETGQSRHELLVRYQRTDRITRKYAGTEEIDEVLTDPAGFVRGRYFLLPDTNLDFATVYLEARDGTLTDVDGRRYRPATDFEAAVSLEQGFVRLLKRPAGRVLVYYEKGGDPVGDVNLGSGGLAGLDGSDQPDLSTTKFDWTVSQAGVPMIDFQITLDGSIDALLLWDGGAWSPFEFQAVYPAEGSAPGAVTTVELLPSGELDPVDEIEGEFGSSTLTLRPAGLPRAVTRYPLAATVPELYGPAREPRVPWVLRYVRPAGRGTISVPADAVAGSIRVTVNGRPESRFTRLPDGSLEFPFPLLPSDEVTVSYELPDRDAAGADLLAVSTNTFTPFSSAPDLELRGDVGVRWNVGPEAYSGEYGESPGSILFGTGAAFEGENWGFAVDGGVSVGTHDTRGYLRLAGMDSGYTEFSISSHSLLPAAPGGIYAHADRAPLAFTDYYQYLDTGGSTLRQYDWSPPADQVYAVADGNPVGPAVASAADDDIEGTVAVLDYDFTLASQWAGAQIAAPGGEPLDLSSATGISFRYRFTAGGSAPALRLRAGATAEDLDGDGIIDEESGPYDAGFPFNQAGNTYYIGGGGNGPRGDFGNGSRESEDLDDDGLLDREGLNAVFEDSPTLVADGLWREVYIPLAAADRTALAETRSLQLILDAAGADSGRLIVGEVRVHGASFVPADGATLVDEVEDTSLRNEFDLVKERFSADGNPQRALRLELTGTAAEAVGPVPAVPLEAYDTLRFYYKLTSGASPDLTLTLEGDEGSYAVALTGLSATSGWDEAEVDLTDGTVRITGGAPATASVSGKRDIVVRRARISVTGGNTGDVLLVDELHLADPVPSVDLGVLAEAHWSADGTLISAGAVPLFGNVEWNGRSRVAEPGFAAGFSAADGRVYAVYQEAAFSSLYSRAELTLNVREGDSGAEVSGGHRLTLPETGPVRLVESYFHDPGNDDFRFTRGERLLVGLPALSAELGAEASYRSATLSQGWDASLSLAPVPAVSVSPAVELSNTVHDPAVEAKEYGPGWLQGTALLGYSEGDLPTDRSAVASLPVVWEPLPELSIALTPRASAERFGRDPRSQRDEAGWTLDLTGEPFAARGTWPGISLRYERTFAAEEQLPTSLSENAFAGDIDRWSASLADQGYLFTAVPVAEIFTPDAEAEFARGSRGHDGADYRPALGMTLSRRLSSRLRDLILPSRLDFTAARNYRREFDSVTSSLSTETAAVARTINLFGRFGATPLFDWYASDEFRTDFRLSTLSGDEDTWSWELENRIDLFGADQNAFSLRNAVNSAEGDPGAAWDAEALVTWYGDSDFKPPRFLPATLAESDPARLRHRDSVAWGVTPVEGESTEWNLGVKHATGIFWGDRGFVEAYLALGIDSTPLAGSEESLTFYAVEAGIVGELSF